VKYYVQNSLTFFFKIEFIHVMQIWIFSIITPVFSVTWSFRNYSICCSKHLLLLLLLLSMLKTVVLLNIYVETVINIYSGFLMNIKNSIIYFFFNLTPEFWHNLPLRWENGPHFQKCSYFNEIFRLYFHVAL